MNFCCVVLEEGGFQRDGSSSVGTANILRPWSTPQILNPCSSSYDSSRGKDSPVEPHFIVFCNSAWLLTMKRPSKFLCLKGAYVVCRNGFLTFKSNATCFIYYLTQSIISINREDRELVSWELFWRSEVLGCLPSPCPTPTHPQWASLETLCSLE